LGSIFLSRTDRIPELNRLEDKRQKPKSEEEKDSEERDKDENKKKVEQQQQQPQQRLRRAYHHMLDSSKPFQRASHPPDTGAEESAPFVGHWRQHVQFLRARQAGQVNNEMYDDGDAAGIGRAELRRGGGMEWKWNGR